MKALALALGALLAPSVASATTCSAPRVIVMIYPQPGAREVPINAQVFLHTDHNRAARTLKLIDLATGRRVRMRRVLSKRSGLVRLIPRKKLRRRHTYEVRRGRSRLASFRTGRRLRKAAPPRLSSVRLLFSAPGKENLSERAGRAARLLTSPLPVAPRVLEVVLELKEPGRRRADRRGVVLLVGVKGVLHDKIAARHVCARVLAAPSAGRFELLVRPWDVIGLEGKARRLSGSIRTARNYATAGRRATRQLEGPKSIVPRAAK